MLTNGQTDADSRVAVVDRLEKGVLAADKDSEALRVVRAHVEDLTAERASLNPKTEQVHVERDHSPARICELEIVAATRDGEIGVLQRTMRFLNGFVAAAEIRAKKERRFGLAK